MSTLLEMAEIVRAAEARVEVQVKPAQVPSREVTIFSSERIARLCELFDTTPWGLSCAIESVGSDPIAIGRFLRTRNANRHSAAVALE